MGIEKATVGEYHNCPFDIQEGKFFLNYREFHAILHFWRYDYQKGSTKQLVAKHTRVRKFCIFQIRVYNEPRSVKLLILHSFVIFFSFLTFCRYEIRVFSNKTISSWACPCSESPCFQKRNKMNRKVSNFFLSNFFASELFTH